jgi:competence protein ComFC
VRTELYLGALADFFYPQRCVSCRRRASDVLCRSCFEALPWIGIPFCRRCGMPTAFDVFVCEECKGVDFGFESARAPLRYEGVGKRIVHALKYAGYLRVVEKLMVPMMREVLTGDFDVVVPVPLHRSRLRRRGFNQAELMARSLAEKIKTPVSDRLEAVRRTRDQVELSAVGRRANVEGAFRMRGAVRGRALLVDDVFTTGATLSACAGALRRAGAGEVHALSLCRTV